MGMQRGAHPLAALRHRLVGQADNGELAATAIGDMDLHIDGLRLNPLEGDGIDVRDCHEPRRCEIQRARP